MLKSIAAGAPGITDVNEGIVIATSYLMGWRDVPLRALLEDALHIPAAVDNDVNLAAIGESWCGAAKDEQNFVFLAIGTGIGAGIVLNGSPYRGTNWAAGEIGYMLVPGIPDIPGRAGQARSSREHDRRRRHQSTMAGSLEPRWHDTAERPDCHPNIRSGASWRLFGTDYPPAIRTCAITCDLQHVFDVELPAFYPGWRCWRTSCPLQHYTGDAGAVEHAKTTPIDPKHTGIRCAIDRFSASRTRYVSVTFGALCRKTKNRRITRQ